MGAPIDYGSMLLFPWIVLIGIIFFLWLVDSFEKDSKRDKERVKREEERKKRLDY